jgi:hypothetical protein
MGHATCADVHVPGTARCCAALIATDAKQAVVNAKSQCTNAVGLGISTTRSLFALQQLGVVPKHRPR